MYTCQQLTVPNQRGGSFLFKGSGPGQETPELSFEGQAGHPEQGRDTIPRGRKTGQCVPLWGTGDYN